MWLRVVLVCLTINAIAAKTPENVNSEFRVDGEYIVAIDVPNGEDDLEGYAATISGKIKALSEKVTVDRIFIFKKVIFLVVLCDDEMVMSEAYDLPEVRVVEANLKQPGIGQDCQAQNTGSNLWGLGRVSYRSPPDYSSAQYQFGSSDGQDTVAYVVDSGINVAHVDYGGRAVQGYTARNLMNSEGEEDLNGHGTHCAGTIMGSTYGVAKSARAVAVKIISGEGFYTGADFLDGVNWMFSDFVQNVNAIGTAYKAVASMSLGGGASTTNDLAVQECIDAGLSVVAAAMNTDSNACTFSPARMEGVITVGATDINERLASFSNWGTCVDVLGPGVNILSTFIGSTTATQRYSGTSMATPHVAGAILRYMTQVGTRPSPAAVRNWLLSTSSREAIDLRGQTSTPNLFLYAPCSVTSEGQVGIDFIEASEVDGSHHGPGHQPGHGPGNRPGHRPGHGHRPPGYGRPPYQEEIGASEFREMKQQVGMVYNMSIAAVVLLALIFLLALSSCCHNAANSERARRARLQWYQSNVAHAANKPAGHTKQSA